MPLTPDQKHNLQLSIVHWEENLALCKDQEYDDIDLSSFSCACCESYINFLPGKNQFCENCPISQHTKEPFCRKTPYILFILPSTRDLIDLMPIATNLELDYLKALLHEDTQTADNILENVLNLAVDYKIKKAR